MKSLCIKYFLTVISPDQFIRTFLLINMLLSFQAKITIRKSDESKYKISGFTI